MNRVPKDFYEVDCADPIEIYFLQLDGKRLISVAIENWTQTNALSGETIFLGRSDVDEE
jgi:hypothetical protein